MKEEQVLMHFLYFFSNFFHSSFIKFSESLYLYSEIVGSDLFRVSPYAWGLDSFIFSLLKTKGKAYVFLN